MLPLKDAIAEKHSQAEKMPFNQRMIKGELTPVEYMMYVCQLQPLFNHIERFPLPHPDMAREERAMVDIAELRLLPGNLTNVWAKPLQTTFHYMQYLLKLNEEKTKPHMYINYLALMFGGQMIKSKVPGTGRMYDFNNMQECIAAVRAIQSDDWAEEANIALDYHIAILDELQEVSELISQQS